MKIHSLATQNMQKLAFMFLLGSCILAVLYTIIKFDSINHSLHCIAVIANIPEVLEPVWILFKHGPHVPLFGHFGVILQSSILWSVGQGYLSLAHGCSTASVQTCLTERRENTENFFSP